MLRQRSMLAPMQFSGAEKQKPRDFEDGAIFRYREMAITREKRSFVSLAEVKDVLEYAETRAFFYFWCCLWMTTRPRH